MKKKELLINNRAVAAALIANTFRTRLRGMLFRNPLPDAMLIQPTNAVHGIGMTQSLDVAFVDAAGAVLQISRLSPFGFKSCRGAASALEAPAGNFAKWNLQVGDVLEFR